MNENKFTGMADIYAKYRPTYPQALIDYLYSDLGFSDKSVIADIGSGTGIFAQLLLLRNSKVFAVEPNEDMRKAAEKNLSSYKNFISVDGLAEKTAINKASCDFVTVAQAYHWFDRLLFKEECGRILKPNGKAVIIYNNRVALSPITTENFEINKRYCPDFNGFSGGMAEVAADEFADFFKGGGCSFKTFQNDLVCDKQSFIGRNLSASYAPKSCDKNYKDYINALENLFEKYSANGRLNLPIVTASFAGQVNT